MKNEQIGRLAWPAILAMASIIGPQQAAAQGNRRVVPAETVVRARLDTTLNSRTAVRGQRFTASLADDDRSGLPRGTRFEGVVTEVRRASKDRPGVLDMEFRRAILPDNQRLTMDGHLASLAAEDVRRAADGRLESRRKGKDKIDLKWIGYGAAGGAVLGGILGDDWLKGALLGGLGGAVYAYVNRDKNRGDYRDVALERGTEFGIRLDQRVAFASQPRYRYASRTIENGRDRYDEDRYRDDRYGSERDDRYGAERDDRYRDDRYRDDRYRDDRYRDDRYRDDRFSHTEVRVDGRAIRFDDERPLRLNGELYVPLAPIARAAALRLDHREGERSFALHTDRGTTGGRVGDREVSIRGERPVLLQNAPTLLEGAIYVPVEYLSRVAGLRADWNGRDRLELETYR